MSDRESEIEELGGLIADERDKFPRRSDDMDSDELAALILSSDWLARVKAEAKAESLYEAADAFPASLALPMTERMWLRARAADLRVVSDAG